MKISDFDYNLPESFIAQTPAEPRDSSRLMVLSRSKDIIKHCQFRDIIDLINPGDVMVFNTTRVIPARLKAYKAETGGAVELLLLRQLSATRWRAIVGGKRVKAGTKLVLQDSNITANVVEQLEEAERIIEFSTPIRDYMDTHGEMPLPPYIHTELDDSERYQTIFSRVEGSAAAPTAGLHFTSEVLLALRKKSVQFAYTTLHIGLGTFQPVRGETIEEHIMHHEYAVLDADNARIINEAKLAGGRIIAVGTTVARTLETAGILSEGGSPSTAYEETESCPWRPVIAFEDDTNLFIHPGYRWRVVDAMLTNFHLPRSTLLMMVSAFAGRERILKAYEIAKQEGYRFFSFGDAMFISD
ncbi:MAG: tRNA preQ1(34) S-adenosylmethionine ribosyltransferase-isomerase QueA [Phototrophicales bacterium]|nr:MAG: tRNA preQ1(34) S-adenosylmethionine ribosyltransferase-isomerase QueA [Phototrophicales bacterium]